MNERDSKDAGRTAQTGPDPTVGTLWQPTTNNIRSQRQPGEDKPDPEEREDNSD